VYFSNYTRFLFQHSNPIPPVIYPYIPSQSTHLIPPLPKLLPKTYPAIINLPTAPYLLIILRMNRCMFGANLSVILNNQPCHTTCKRCQPICNLPDRQGDEANPY
jgi:hypothetical protein